VSTFLPCCSFRCPVQAKASRVGFCADSIPGYSRYAVATSRREESEALSSPFARTTQGAQGREEREGQGSEAPLPREQAGTPREDPGGGSLLLCARVRSGPGARDPAPRRREEGVLPPPAPLRLGGRPRAGEEPPPRPSVGVREGLLPLPCLAPSRGSEEGRYPSLPLLREVEGRWVGARPPPLRPRPAGAAAAAPRRGAAAGCSGRCCCCRQGCSSAAAAAG
jgi:hypothetical protein